MEIEEMPIAAYIYLEEQQSRVVVRVKEKDLN
jgi:hypothetical protein